MKYATLDEYIDISRNNLIMKDEEYAIVQNKEIRMELERLSKEKFIKTFGMRDVAIVHFFELNTGDYVATIDSNKTSGIEFTAEPVAARGGVGNHKRVIWSGTKDGKITLEDCLHNLDVNGIQTGNAPVYGEATITKSEILKVASGKINLSHTPVGDLVAISVDGKNLEKAEGETASAGKYAITGKAITIDASDAEDGQNVRVFYNVKAPKSVEVKITADAQVKAYKVIMESNVVDSETQETYKAQILIPMARPDENFNLMLSAEGEPSSNAINLEILKPSDSEDLYSLIVYDDKDIA